MSEPKTICLDFDGVVHLYKRPWTRVSEIHDGPVPGAREFCAEAIDAGYRVVICDARARTAAMEIKAWLTAYRFPAEVNVVSEKPAAVIYIDDRGWRFEGTFPSLELVRSLRPWNRQEG